METSYAILLGAAITGVFSLLATIVNKYGMTFWRPSRKIRFSGRFFVIQRMEKSTVYTPESTESLEQEVRNGILSIRSNKCLYSSEYIFRMEGEILSSGKMTGKGVFHNGVAFIVYTIKDSTKHQFWYGTMLLHVTDWGNMYGYLMNESITQKGKTGIVFVELKRD